MTLSARQSTGGIPTRINDATANSVVTSKPVAVRTSSSQTTTKPQCPVPSKPTVVRIPVTSSSQTTTTSHYPLTSKSAVVNIPGTSSSQTNTKSHCLETSKPAAAVSIPVTSSSQKSRTKNLISPGKCSIFCFILNPLEKVNRNLIAFALYAFT